jgi:hypothetical protein
VHERIAMDALDCRGGIHRLRRLDAEQRRTLDHEERPEALAASEQRMPHGGAKARAFARAVCLKHSIEALLGEPGRVTKPLHNPH